MISYSFSKNWISSLLTDSLSVKIGLSSSQFQFITRSLAQLSGINSHNQKFLVTNWPNWTLSERRSQKRRRQRRGAHSIQWPHSLGEFWAFKTRVLIFDGLLRRSSCGICHSLILSWKKLKMGGPSAEWRRCRGRVGRFGRIDGDSGGGSSRW